MPSKDTPPGRRTCTRNEGETARRIKAIYDSPRLYSLALKLNLSTCINNAARFAKVFDVRLSKAELYLAVITADYRDTALKMFQSRVEANLEDARKERASPPPKPEVKRRGRKRPAAVNLKSKPGRDDTLTLVPPFDGLTPENTFYLNAPDDALAPVGFPEGARILVRRVSELARGRSALSKPKRPHTSASSTTTAGGASPSRNAKASADTSSRAGPRSLAK